MAAGERKQIHPDYPVDKAWQEGRRLYVVAAYESRLSKALLEVGTTWDGDRRARWAGSTKRSEILAALDANLERRRKVEEIKARGRWVAIPPAAETIRARAHQLNALYDGVLKQWAFRDDAGRDEVAALVRDYHAEQAAAAAAEEKDRQRQWAREKAERAERQAAGDRLRRENILARSGRAATGETAELREIFTRRMNKATAQQIAREAGAVVRLSAGRYGVVTDVKIWFSDSESASSSCWHQQTHDQAHWDFAYTLAIVEPTDAERADEEQRGAEIRDTAELAALVEQAPKLTGARGCEPGYAHIPEAERVGSITLDSGTTRFSNGELILTRDGRLVWQHPGYYDEYRRTEGVTTDPQAVERARRLITAGTRTRDDRHSGQQEQHYTVTHHPDDTKDPACLT